jgi:molybdopterin molybdotransferase
VPALPFAVARQIVVDRLKGAERVLEVESLPLSEAAGRVLAAPVRADRDLPPTARSVRDGFAVRAAETPGTLRVAGEVRAGQAADKPLAPGTAIEIMTGAPMPEGADAVVMVEHVTRDGREVTVPAAQAGQNFNPRGVEAAAGAVLLEAGARLSYPGVALCASVGAARVEVYRKPRVAILATGDELVPYVETPLPHQVRNSNAASLAVQVSLSGGEAVMIPPAPDELERTIALIERGLKADLLLLSGGVSAGKYDVVEKALHYLGATLCFDRVAIQPGQPLVFGRVKETFFFGLPGNPASTMVCFEVFARAAVDLLGGRTEAPLPMTRALVEEGFTHRPGLTRFLPARLSEDGATVRRIGWSGSSDVAAVARANCFLVADADTPEYRAGDWIPVLGLER